MTTTVKAPGLAVKEIAPLRAVIRVDDGGAGSGNANNPRRCWLSREFTLHLECGHSEDRVKIVQRSVDVLHAPRRIRCKDCQPATVPVKAARPKPAPEFDPLVGALIRSAIRLAPDKQDHLLTWALTFGRWIPDPSARAAAYAAVALHLVDGYAPSTGDPEDPAWEWKPAARVRAAIAAWANDPSSENAGTVRVESRRAYGSQSARRTGRNWLARRGIIAAAKIASGPPYDTKGILESLSWHRSTRQAHYASLFSLRSELGSLHLSELASPAAAEDTADGAVLRALHADAEKKILAEMDEKFANLQELVQEHLPALLDCLAVYEYALIEEGAAEPGQRELGLGAVAGVPC